MNAIHPNSKPGCLGRMVDIFDLASIKSNRLLTDKPHYTDSSTSRSRPDVSRMSNFAGNEMQDDAMISPSKTSRGTPNVVARLMGLDALPDMAAHMTHSRSHSQNDYKDIYEIWHESQGRNIVGDKSSKKNNGFCSENADVKKLGLIRQKFRDEKLRDALDVLSSNGDLFLGVLQEPNYGGEKQITVLKPSKIVVEKPVEFPPTMSMWKDCDSPARPTRIVVLKPSTAKKLDISSTPRILQSENFGVESEDEEGWEAREVAKEITQRMRENLRRDETLLSSALSNGYTGNLSDSEVMSPTSRNSWDYSLTSFSRGSYSYSSESSVCREAKRRLSERWAMTMMSSTRCSQGQSQIRKSSSTLGEMLAISEVIKPEIREKRPIVEVSKDTKMKSAKSSFAGKFSRLLFSRKKKPKKENDESEFVFSPITGENKEEPSPISVLEPAFEDEERKLETSVFPSRSNLIDKSPPIGTISRTLSFSECGSAELATSTPPFRDGEDEEYEWWSLVQSLLTMAGLDNDDCGPHFARWHSPDSPLDPSLRETYVDVDVDLPVHEAKRRKLRSTQKLVFDFVNETLMDTTGVVRSALTEAHKERVSRSVKGPPEEEEDDGGASVVERQVWKEVMGKGWDDQVSLEVEIIGKELEGKLLMELVEESVLECTTITD